jgi:DNA polymerase I-like protein with 3'-5' exonuclease and polymerase domains
MGPPKLADTLQIPIEEAEQLFKEYAQSFPKLNNWLASQAKFGKVNGYIRLPTPHKGIRWFDDIALSKELRKNQSDDWKTILTIEGQAERNSMNSPKCMGLIG